MSEKQETNTGLTPEQQFLNNLWEEHLRDEFMTRDTNATLDTMVPDAYVNHIPVLTGGVGRAQLREFYSRHFIPKMPLDTEIVPISRTIGADRLVDEMIFRFTHTLEMDWMLPGVAPTGKRVECALVVIVQFREGKLAHEHIYWDQASVLVQLGLLDSSNLPVAGRETAEKLLDPGLPSNDLIHGGLPATSATTQVYSSGTARPLLVHYSGTRRFRMPSADKPSLYERLGGVYSIATVVDDLIDRVMSDPRLNANPLVDEAHHRVPPAGFKYLVTEMVCWASGGPQKYTGRSMADSHVHLKITGKEWEAFLDDFQQTLDKFAVPGEEQAELKAIVNSTRSDIVADSALGVGAKP